MSEKYSVGYTENGGEKLGIPFVKGLVEYDQRMRRLETGEEITPESVAESLDGIAEFLGVTPGISKNEYLNNLYNQDFEKFDIPLEPTLPHGKHEKIRKLRTAKEIATAGVRAGSDGDVDTLETRRENYVNPLLSFAMSEHSPDCSIAASSAYRLAHEVIGQSANTKQFLVVSDGDDVVENLTYATLVSDLPSSGVLPVNFMLAKNIDQVGAPLYLFATTRDNIAFRVASFVKRGSQTQCDYVQIGQEMYDDNFVVTPADEEGSRIDIIESIKQIIEPNPITNIRDFSVYTGAGSMRIDTVFNFNPNLGARHNLQVFALVRELSRAGVIYDPKLTERWEGSVYANKRRLPKYEKMAREEIARVIETGKLSPKRKDDFSLALIMSVIKAAELYNSSRKTFASKLINQVDLNTDIISRLGVTTTDYEYLVAHKDGLQKLAGRRHYGIVPDVTVGKTSDDAEFELVVESVGVQGYLVHMAARASSQSDKPFVHAQTFLLPRDREPTQTAIDSAPDIKDLLPHIKSSTAIEG